MSIMNTNLNYINLNIEKSLLMCTLQTFMLLLSQELEKDGC